MYSILWNLVSISCVWKQFVKTQTNRSSFVQSTGKVHSKSVLSTANTRWKVLCNASLISSLVSRSDMQFTCWRSPVVFHYFRDYRNVQRAGRSGCDAVSLGTGLRAFWRNELPSSSSGRQFKKNLTAWTWIWRHYLLRNITNHSPNPTNPPQDRYENLKPCTWECQ
jgi:hypothetical protein